MLKKSLLVIVSTLLLAGCWNGGNTAVSLGDISLGQQLIDLKAAFDAQAITHEEYEVSKAGLLALGNACEAGEDDGARWF